MLRVYFMREAGCTHRHKIGYSISPVHRMAQLQTGNRRRLEIYREISSPYARAIERALHHKYRRERIRGEWFDVAQHVVDFEHSRHRHLDFVSQLHNEGTFAEKIGVPSWQLNRLIETGGEHELETLMYGLFRAETSAEITRKRFEHALMRHVPL